MTTRGGEEAEGPRREDHGETEERSPTDSESRRRGDLSPQRETRMAMNAKRHLLFAMGLEEAIDNTPPSLQDTSHRRV